MKKYWGILVVLMLFISINLEAQPSHEKVIKNLKKGEWFFNSIDVPGKNTFISMRDIIETHDSCQKYLSYKFLDENKVEIKNNKLSSCNEITTIKFWSVINLHDEAGKSYNGIRITEEAASERDNYDKNTYNDDIFLIVFSNRNNLQIVAKPQYKSPNLDKVINYFRMQKFY